MIQTLKLGLAGSETTLQTKSRINDGGTDTFKYNSGESADGSLKIDIIATKKNFTVSWEIMSEADFNILYNIYLLQLGGNFLSYIETDQAGTEHTYTVFMQPPTRGTLIVKDVYYTNAVTINMQEV